MELIYLDLEDERPGFIEDPTFNVIPDIEDFFDVDFDFLEEDEESEEEEGEEVFNVRNNEEEARCCSAWPQLR